MNHASTLRSAPRAIARACALLAGFALGLTGCQESPFGLDDGGAPGDAGPSADGGPAPTPDASVGGCVLGGVLHPVGSSFPSSDGCNSCSCLASGQAVCTLRACTAPTACGGLAGFPCPSGQFCEYAEGAACGAADQLGTCTTPPTACDEQYAPVCGCDGRTYANACHAEAARTSVARSGACGSTGLICNTDSDCPVADCACLDANHDGVCENTCPVLSCRGGVCVNVIQGQICGGFAGFACGAGQYCEYGASCGSGDQSGSCEPQPQACDALYDPVCGCDGKTYASACYANMAGVTAKSRGACGSALPVGASCGGLVPAGTPGCAAGTFCQFPVSSYCGAADGPGVCTAIPQVCTDLYAPVCGCDGKTYPNACSATAAQASIQASGACK